jgi:hypothetical protein
MPHSIIPESKYFTRKSVIKCSIPFVDAIFEYGSVSLSSLDASIYNKNILIIMFGGTYKVEFSRPSNQHFELIQEVDDFLEKEIARHEPLAELK